MAVQGKYILDSSFDPDAFLADMNAARDAVGPATEKDAGHLLMLVNLARTLSVGGQILLFLGVTRPVGLLMLLLCAVGCFGISTARCMQWTIIGHHVSHGGFDKLQKSHPEALPKHYKRGIFAVGYRRFIDWLDWMLPSAWDVEHNKMHHYYLSEDKDPDLVERNFELLHKLPLPSFMKYASMLFWMGTWKWTYYSPNTFKELELSRPRSLAAARWPKRRPRTEPLTVMDFFFLPVQFVFAGDFADVFFWPIFGIQWLIVVTPMVMMIVLPALLPVALGKLGVWNFALPWQTVALKALAASAIADVMSNVHSFVIVACNHSGSDMWRYKTSCKSYSAEWFLRCAYSSVNFETGNDFVDIMYGWLNYQIEHHMFPDMTTLQYRQLQPLVKAVCKKHGVQYVQQNGLYRTWRMLRCAVGDDHMSQCDAIIPPAAAK